jgi:hypothetical protein
MRPKHGRHSYKNSKFRKKDAGFNMRHFNDWYMEEFTPRFMVRIKTDTGVRYETPPQYRMLWLYFKYKPLRKLYNESYKRTKARWKKNGGFCIGDQFWSHI